MMPDPHRREHGADRMEDRLMGRLSGMDIDRVNTDDRMRAIPAESAHRGPRGDGDEYRPSADGLEKCVCAKDNERQKRHRKSEIRLPVGYFLRHTVIAQLTQPDFAVGADIRV